MNNDNWTDMTNGRS